VVSQAHGMKPILKRLARHWVLAAFLMLRPAATSAAADAEVVLYCAQDEEFAEPILAAFAKETGIKVKPVFDSEAVKTVGIAARLLAERAHPQCDVYWGNEELRARQLAAAGVFRATNGWAAFGRRTRRIVYNPGRLTETTAPHSLRDLTNAAWRGRVSVALPVFGTTSTHFLALRRQWGAEVWRTWCAALAANHPWIEEGNSQVAQRVGRGQAWVGLTDSDDIENAKKEGLSVAALPVDQDMLVLPNTVGVINGAPHPQAAEALFRRLQSPGVAAALKAAGALEDTVRGTAGMQPDWEALLRDLPEATGELERVFRK
jgi:iron(III) transport system substrate-binding protein